MIANIASAQSQARTKLMCVTVSCCGVGPFSIEIWKETTCHYVEVRNRTSQNVYAMTFETNGTPSEVTVPEDVMLAGMFAENGDNLVLPRGRYAVANNEIQFTPTTFKARKYCYIREVKGELFGHAYEYTIDICISFGRSSAKGVVAVNPRLSEDQLTQIMRAGGELKFKEDVRIQTDGINYTLKAGKYTVNQDGNIYLQNAQLR